MFIKCGSGFMVAEKSKIKREKSEYAVQAVSNAIDILELLGNFEHELSITEILTQLSLTKSNVNKLLANLESFGYVEHNRYTGNFRLGVKTFQISQAYINKLNLTDISMQNMQELKAKLNESVYIGVLRQGNVVYLDVVETDEAVRVMPRIGNVGPAYATAIGKAQLSLKSEGEIREFYKDGIKKLTPKTTGSIEELLKNMEEVRRNGYAVDAEEYEEGVCCIGSPILNFMGEVIAGISVSAPCQRMSPERVEKEIIPALLETAKNLSTKFGFRAGEKE